MNTIFGELTPPFIKTTLSKNTSVLALLMFHETREGKPENNFGVLSCVIYTRIENYVCIGYLACQSKKLSEISVYSKYVEKILTEYWVLGFQIC